MSLKLDVVMIGVSVLAAFAALFYISRAWFSLTLTSDEVLRAKAFLTKPFMHRNFMFVFVMSIFIVTHTVFEYAELVGYPSNLGTFSTIIHLLYISALMISMILLALLAHHWHRLLSSKSMEAKK